MPDWEGLLGEGSAARQLLVYGVGYEIARALLGPMFTQIEYMINAGHPIIELSPAELAELVVRGVVAGEAEVADRIAKYGLDADRLHEMYLLAGEPPGLVQVMEWWRRGFIPWDAGPGKPSAAEAIRTSRVYSYWADTFKQGQFAPPSPALIVDALIRQQISRDDAIGYLYKTGFGVEAPALPEGADTGFVERALQIAFDTGGRPPSPGQLAELVHRGVIPVSGAGPKVVSFEQGVFEGDLKDKWEKPLEGLLEVIPSLYEIRILQEHGAVTDAQAAAWLAQLGYSSDVAASVAEYATAQAVVTDRQTTQATITTLYKEGGVTEAEATQLLSALGYGTEAAQFILAATDLQRGLGALNSAVSRIGTYFIAHKLDANGAAAALRTLELPADQITTLIQTWTVAQGANLKLLTEAQVADAWEYGIMTQQQAQSELEGLGYTPFDAWVVLSVKNKAPLPGQPAPNPGGIT